jgi:rubrerythrin
VSPPGEPTTRTIITSGLQPPASKNRLSSSHGQKFRDLSEREILVLAISLEEEDARIYVDYADGLRDTYPDTAKIFDEMLGKETEHRKSLVEI